MNIVPTDVPGLFDLLAEPKPDERGYLVKTFEASTFAQAGLATEFQESLHTCSRRGVLRGMHFQTPPCPQAKVVFCEHGSVFDVVVDLRHGSPTFGGSTTRMLTAERGNGLYVPSGLAHGFLVTSESAVVSYQITTAYAPGNDAGVLWSSVDVEWPIIDPIVSERDRGLPAMTELGMVFTYAATSLGER